MARKPEVVEEEEGPNKDWMESWADAMTLLMAFFVMLFAFALVDETKFADFKVGMVTALGVADPVAGQADSILENGEGIALTVGLTTEPDPRRAMAIEEGEEDLADNGSVSVENIEDVRDLLEAKFIENGTADFVSVDIDERGVVVRYDGRLLFRSGSAELSVGSDVVLAATSDVLQLVDNAVDIEGHTDDIPTGGRWISNWELSAARASAVVRWMEGFGAIPSRRLAAVGMGETRPLVPNDSDENRAQNRRVEVVIRVAGVVDAGIDVMDPIGDPIEAPIADTSPLNGADASLLDDAESVDEPTETTPENGEPTDAPPESTEPNVPRAVRGTENFSSEE